jgi:hypothetical protein
MTKLKQLPRFTLKQAGKKGAKPLYLHDTDKDGKTTYWNLYPTTMFTKESLEQTQKDYGCGGRIIRHGSVPEIRL